MDTPANMMTPTIFAERAKKEFTGIEGITLNVHDEGGFAQRVPLLHDTEWEANFFLLSLTTSRYSLGKREEDEHLPIGSCRNRRAS